MGVTAQLLSFKGVSSWEENSLNRIRLKRRSVMVQLEVEVEEGVWKPAIRYDCAHDFAHRDR